MNPYPGNVVFHRVPAMNSMVAHSKLVFNRFFWRSLCGWGVSVTQLAWLITWHILRKTGWRRKTRKTAKKYRSEKNQYLEKVPVLVLEEFFFGKKYWSSYRKHFNFFLVPYSWIICPLFCWAMCKLRKMEVAHVGSCASGKLSKCKALTSVPIWGLWSPWDCCYDYCITTVICSRPNQIKNLYVFKNTMIFVVHNNLMNKCFWGQYLVNIIRFWLPYLVIFCQWPKTQYFSDEKWLFRRTFFWPTVLKVCAWVYRTLTRVSLERG